MSILAFILLFFFVFGPWLIYKNRHKRLRLAARRLDQSPSKALSSQRERLLQIQARAGRRRRELFRG